MGAWSELDAVNHVLEAGGEEPVSDLDVDSSSSIPIVQRRLKAERLKVLSRGHGFNTTYPYLTPNISNKIAIGDEILSVDGWQEDKYLKLTVKEGFLYDLDNETDEFEDNVHVKIISDVNWSDLRTQLQYQIMAAAAKAFQRTYQQDPIVDAELVEEEMEARVAASEEENRNNNYMPRDNTPLGRVLNKGVFKYD